MSIAADPFNDFLMKNCGMSQVTAKKFKDAFEQRGIDGVKIAKFKAKDGSLRPLLSEITSKVGADASYETILINELNRFVEKDGEASDASELIKKQKEVDAALKAARDYREAAVRDNKAALDASYASLDGALQKVAPDAGWNVPVGRDLVPKMDQLIKDITGLSVTVAAGNYDSDHQLLTQISKGILRKAAIFLPGKLIGQRAAKPLYNFQVGVSKSELAETTVFEQHFSNNSVSASYKNDLFQNGTANTVTVEAGAFFGVGAVALSASFSEASASERSYRVNSLTETREAVGLKVHCVHKASFDVNLEDIILNVSTVVDRAEKAADFLEAYGTHVIVAPQILGGLYVLSCTVSFKNNVKSESYKEALSTTLTASESIHGWGVTKVGIGKISAAAAQDSSDFSAHASGTTSFDDSYTATTSIDILGPSCLDASAFRTSLNNGSRGWAFVNNGLRFDEAHRGAVVNQIEPVWKLFDLAGRGTEASLLREAWLNCVLDTDAAVDPNTFFSKLVHKTLYVDSLKDDKADWTKVFEDKLAHLRPPVAIKEKATGETKFDVDGNMPCRYLDRHPVGHVGINHILTRFQLQTDAVVNPKIRYHFETVALIANGVRVTAIEREDTTRADVGADLECCYFDRHLVRGPPGTVLTWFHLKTNHTNMWYEFKYATLSAGAEKFTYLAKDVKRSETLVDHGAWCKEVKWLDRQNVVVPVGHVLIGFKLSRNDTNIYYEYWHVAVSDLKKV